MNDTTQAVVETTTRRWKLGGWTCEVRDGGLFSMWFDGMEKSRKDLADVEALVHRVLRDTGGSDV